MDLQAAFLRGFALFLIESFWTEKNLVAKQCPLAPHVGISETLPGIGIQVLC